MIWDFRKFSQNIAFYTQNKQISYEKLASLNDELFANIGRRTLVFVLASNTLGSAVGYTCFLNNNIATLMLSSDINEQSLSEFIATYQPEFIWMPDPAGREQNSENSKWRQCFSENSENSEIVRSSRTMTNESSWAMTENSENSNIIYKNFGYALLKTGFKTPVLNDELALLVTTSGSTSSAKLVRQSYKNILSNTKSIVEYLKIDEKERAITTLPMNYTYGLSIINTHLFAGGSVVLNESTIIQREFWDLLESSQATSFGGVPYTYEILDKLRFTKKDLPFLRTFTQAGGKLSVELHEKFAKYAKETNKNFVVMYGQSEATARISYLPANEALEKIGSIGVVIPNGKLELVDENGEIISQTGKSGELIYSGENVALGYATCLSDLSKGDEFGGRLDTGDMAMFDEDGYFSIVGRKKRFIKIYGNRIGLDECERDIKANFGDFDVACVGVDDKMSVYITDLNFLDAVKDFLSQKTKINPKAFSVNFIEQIPRNSAGKITYSELKND